MRWPAPRIHRTGYSSTAVTKGGRNTKLHAVCDEKGRPCVLLLTPRNVHDCKVAQRCIEAMPPSTELVAIKAMTVRPCVKWLDARGTEAVIPPRKNRKTQYDYDKAVYKQRNIIERMFCRLKDWRRIATRFDRNLKAFMAATLSPRLSSGGYDQSGP